MNLYFNYAFNILSINENIRFLNIPPKVLAYSNIKSHRFMYILPYLLYSSFDIDGKGQQPQ